jgi:hypothetical protein
MEGGEQVSREAPEIGERWVREFDGAEMEILTIHRDGYGAPEHIQFKVLRAPNVRPWWAAEEFMQLHYPKKTGKPEAAEVRT